jgi:hypothetical protein
MKVPMHRVVLAALMLWAVPVLGTAGEVTLTIRDGRATLIARDATIRQILTEWARVGRTRVVNLERVPGGPVTLEFRDLPESQALRIILKPLGGFMAAPRPVADPTLSRFDRIVVMTTLATPAAPAMAAAAPSRPQDPRPESLLPPGFRGTRQQGLGDGVMGRPRRFDDPGAADDDGESGDNETAADDFRQPQLGRPALGQRPPMTPPTLPQSGDTQGSSPQPLVPSSLTPGATASRPGVVVPPPKPPGDSRPQ